VYKRQLNKQQLLNSFDGCCWLCKYNKYAGALDFHHLDPSQKDFQISQYSGNNFISYEMAVELSKCILLCKNCHSEVHAGIRGDELKENVPHEPEEFMDW
jgi:5-methylcytosine-specific restriction endonuclease McrA